MLPTAELDHSWLDNVYTVWRWLVLADLKEAVLVVSIRVSLVSTVIVCEERVYIWYTDKKVREIFLNDTKLQKW